MITNIYACILLIIQSYRTCVYIMYLIHHLYDLKQLSGDLYALNDEAAELLTVSGSCIGYKKSL